MIEPIFKYIFAAVIGAMLLVFFIGFAGQQIGLFGKAEGYRGLYAFNDYLTAMGIDLNSESEYGHKVDFTFLDNRIYSGSSSIETQHIIFSRERIKGYPVIATRTFEFPYTTAYLYYTAEKRMRYALIYDETTKDFVEELASEYGVMPSKFNLDKIDGEQFDLERYEDMHKNEVIRYVIFTKGKNAGGVEGIEDKDFIVVKPDDGESGAVEFEEGSADYVGRELVAGAIVSGDLESYEEKLDRLAGEVRYLAKVYYGKAGILQQEIPNCDYSKIRNALTGLAGIENLDLGAWQKAESVKEANSELGGECPKVY